MNTSQAAINRIKDLEGFRPTAYQDGSASGVIKFSIGYGHQIGIAEQNLKTSKITTAQGDTLLKSDVSPIEIQINRDLKVKPTQNQFDALVDFGYNCGSGALGLIIGTWNSTHNTKAVTDRMLLYNKTHDNKTGQLVVSSVLQSRREKEVAIFNSSLPPVSIKSALMAVAGFGVALYLLT